MSKFKMQAIDDGIWAGQPESSWAVKEFLKVVLARHPEFALSDEYKNLPKKFKLEVKVGC